MSERERIRENPDAVRREYLIRRAELVQADADADSTCVNYRWPADCIILLPNSDDWCGICRERFETALAVDPDDDDEGKGYDGPVHASRCGDTAAHEPHQHGGGRWLCVGVATPAPADRYAILGRQIEALVEQADCGSRVAG